MAMTEAGFKNIDFTISLPADVWLHFTFKEMDDSKDLDWGMEAVATFLCEDIRPSADGKSDGFYSHTHFKFLEETSQQD